MNYTLSAAMKKGILLTRPARNQYWIETRWWWPWSQKILASCAYSAAWVGVFGCARPEGGKPADSLMVRMFPMLATKAACPASGCSGDGGFSRCFHVPGATPDWVGNRIHHLYEYHKWKRLDIAYWIETLEAGIRNTKEEVED